jgi:hypothetical protein
MEQATEHSAAGGVTFSTLLMMFGTTGMAQLGVVPEPAGSEMRVDLDGARHTIELLEVLEQKTVGNLTEPEAGLLEGILFDLRLRYVEATKGR